MCSWFSWRCQFWYEKRDELLLPDLDKFLWKHKWLLSILNFWKHFLLFNTVHRDKNKTASKNTWPMFWSFSHFSSVLLLSETHVCCLSLIDLYLYRHCTTHIHTHTHIAWSHLEIHPVSGSVSEWSVIKAVYEESPSHIWRSRHVSFTYVLVHTYVHSTRGEENYSSPIYLITSTKPVRGNEVASSQPEEEEQVCVVLCYRPTVSALVKKTSWVQVRFVAATSSVLERVLHPDLSLSLSLSLLPRDLRLPFEVSILKHQHQLTTEKEATHDFLEEKCFSS